MNKFEFNSSLENQENLDERHDNWFKDKIGGWAQEHPDIIEKIKIYTSGATALGASAATFLMSEDPMSKQFMTMINGVSSGAVTYGVLSLLFHKLGLEQTFDKNKE